MGSMFFDMVAGDVKKYTNLFHPCPFSVCISKDANFLDCLETFKSVPLQGRLYAKDVVLDDSSFPSFLPSAFYWFDLCLFRKEKIGFKFLGRGQVFAKLTKKSYKLG